MYLIPCWNTKLRVTTHKDATAETCDSKETRHSNELAQNGYDATTGRQHNQAMDISFDCQQTSFGRSRLARTGQSGEFTMKPTGHEGSLKKGEAKSASDVKNTARQPCMVGFLVVVLVGLGTAQTSAKETTAEANVWLRTPSPYLSWNKSVSVETRAQRDRFMDEAAFPIYDTSSEPITRIKITSPGAYEPVTNSGCDGAASGPEIVDDSRRVVLTGTFRGHQSVLSATEYSLYSELIFGVDRVFENKPATEGAVAGKDISLLSDAGTVLLSTGAKFSHGLKQPDFDLQLNHEYLLELAYFADGDFYLPLAIWDLSNGTVRPGDCRTRYRAASGRSALNGLSVSQYPAVLVSLLSGSK